MKNKIKLLTGLLVAGLAITFTACKKNPETPATKEEPAKTLNKATLTNNKTWYDKSGVFIHPFKAGGVYNYDGKWRWVGNSDTMEIDDDNSGNYVKWKFYYNTDTEMKARWINNEQDILFKSSRW